MFLRLSRFNWWHQNKKGATIVEYALIAGLVAAVSITAIGLMGGNLKNKYSEIGNGLPTNP